MTSGSLIMRAVQGTAIALVTWLVLYLTKEHLGRTAALVLAGVIFLFFVFAFWARMRVRAGGGSGRHDGTP
jgi:4-amino-4-deoxy-L-arabinose transferase-like glycosyltransferase